MERPVVAHPFENGPYLQIAALCEKVLQEKDGVLSLIRVVDVIRHVVQGPSVPDRMPSISVDLVAVISFKAGQARGRQELTLQLRSPSGLVTSQSSVPLHFHGAEESGTNLAVRMAFQVDAEGVYWINVHLEGIFVTRIPLRVEYAPVTTETVQGSQ